MRSAVTVVAVLSVALAAVATAGAAPGWRPAVKVESAPSASALSFPKVAARPGGCATVAFERGDDVYASTRPPGGVFAPTQDLGPIAPNKYPSIAAAGSVALAWDGGSSVRVALAGGCDPLAAAATVPGSDASAEEPIVAVDGSGRAILAFEAGGSGSRRIYLSEVPPGGSPTAAEPLAPPAGTEAFRAKLGLNGSAAGLAFDVVSSGNQVYGSLRAGPSSWTAPVQLNAAGKPAVAGSTEVAMGADGSLHAVWIDAGNKEVILATLSPVGVVSRASLIVAGGIVREPAIATDAAGRLAVVWAEQTGAGQARIYGKHREPGGALSPQRSVSAATVEFRGNPVVAFDPRGRTIVAWSELAAASATQETAAATRQPGTDFYLGSGTISDAALSTTPSGISADGDGNTLVALYVTESPREAQVAAFDAASPLASGLSVPSGAVGSVLPFSIGAVDAWSPTVPARWDFGDGTSADGYAVDHVYAIPGTFSVRATVADSLGNAGDASAVTTVVPRPPTRGVGPEGPVTRDLAPRLAKLKVRPARFEVGPGPRKGARVTFRLSERARLRIAVKPRGGAFARVGRAGPNRFRFAGRVRGRALAPGPYRLRVVAIGATGKRSQPRFARFAIVLP